MKTVKLFRAWLLVALALFALAGCGSKEAEQRSAFITFLQTRVLDKPGVRVPKPSEEQNKSFGDYAAHYAVIADFNEGMNQSVGRPMNEIVAKGAIRSVGDLVTRRDDLKVAKDGIGRLRSALDAQLAKADAAHAALKQPDELKAVYDKAYERTVTQPAGTFKEVFPALDAVFDVAIRAAEFIAQNKGTISVSGATVTVSDAKVQAELSRILQDLNTHGAAINEAQRRLQSLVRGG